MSTTTKEVLKDFENPAGVKLDVEQLSVKRGRELLTLLMNDSMFEEVFSKPLAERSQGEQSFIEEFSASVDKQLLCQIIKKRIEGFTIPVEFSPAALLTAYVWSESPRPGVAVTMLIDALNKYAHTESKVLINAQMMCEVYPFGFYTEEAFTKYVDEYLKPAKVKWGYIYDLTRKHQPDQQN